MLVKIENIWSTDSWRRDRIALCKVFKRIGEGDDYISMCTTYGSSETFALAVLSL